MPSKLTWLRILMALLFFSTVTVSTTSATAVGESLEIVLDQDDGTPTFDASDGPGLDSGPNNGIVRTNDNITYQVEVSVNDAPGSDVTFTLPLPRGVELGAIPPYCVTGSSLTPATLPGPVLPITMTSWTSLPTQTLVCNIGPRTAFSTFTYPVVAKVRSEVPNGTDLDPTIASVVSADVVTPAVSAPLSTRVSARAQFDLSKNSASEVENAGYFSNQGIRTCADGSGRSCFGYIIPMLIAAPAGGKGTTPLQMPVTFTDDLTPASLYGPGVLSDPDYVAAGANAAQKYGAILVRCRALSWAQPYPRIGGPATAATGVRQSGTTDCAQPGGPGTPVSVSITGMDSSAYTVPSQAYRPAGRTLPANRGYVYSWSIYVQIPVETVIDLGVVDSLGSTWTLDWDNRYSDFDPVGIDGVVNDPSAQEAFNDYRSSRSVASTRGSFDVWYGGIGNAVGNVPPVEFSPGWSVWEGPPGSTGTQTGEAQIYPGQPILSLLHFSARNAATQQDVTFLACDSWDPALVNLAAANYPASSVARAQGLPSNGEPVWIHGRAYDGQYASVTNPLQLPTLSIEYGNGAGGAGTTCTDADSPGGWSSDPALVPGNDPGKASQGIYTGVSQVRVSFTVPPHQTGAGTWVWVAIGLRAADGLAVDTIIPNFASGKVEAGSLTMSEMLASPRAWTTSSYVPATNVGARGDRVRVGTAVARLAKEVQDPDSGTWVTTTPAVTGGDIVDFRLSPTITAAVDFSVSVPLKIEDCLPSGEVFLSSSPSPTRVEPSSPPDSAIACGAGETYVLWDLGPMPVNEVVSPITYTVRISPLSTSEVKTNRAAVTAQGDPSDISKRTASASVQVTQPAGVSLDKRALTPQVEINLPGESNPDLLRWQINLANFDTSPGPTSPDMIDVLPVNGQGTTNYSGGLEFVSASVQLGGPTVEVLYTSAPVVDPDPNDVSNLAGGSTLWCDQAAAGSVVLGSGSSASCPQTPSDVTGVRVRRPGAFGAGSQIIVDITMLPTANSAGDVYLNSVSARAGGLVELVGPVTAPATIVASSVGDLVWIDVDGDGIRDQQDGPIEGVRVDLVGTDSDGNPVSATSQTAADGRYRFANIASGSYTITFGLPAPSGLGQPHFTRQGVGLDPTVDSDGDPTNGQASFTLPANFTMTDVDQGVFYPNPEISLVKRINGDDAPTAPGATVNLGSTMIVTFEVTNTGNVVVDTLSVADDTVAGSAIVCPGGPIPPGGAQECSASLAAPLFGQLHYNTATATATPEALADGTQLADIRASDDAYATALASSVEGRVFFDIDNNGIQDGNDWPIDGVDVSLSGIDDYGNAVVAITTTGSDGAWSFDGLVAGTYEVAETQPAGFNDGVDTIGSAGGVLDPVGDTVTDIILGPGENATAYNFAEVGTTLSGVVWLDEDQSGTREGSEVGRLEGVKIVLRDVSGTVLAETITDSMGFYQFTDLVAGTYQVAETQPEGYGSSTRNDLSVVVPLEGLTDVDLGETLGAISGRVWDDANSDGVRGATETVRAQVVMLLLDSLGQPVASTLSDTNGDYRFEGLRTGEYSVAVTAPDGLALTMPLQGEDSAVDSDIDWVSMASAVLRIETAACMGPLGVSLVDCVGSVADIDAGLISDKIDLAVTKDLVITASGSRIGEPATWSVLATNNSTTPLPGVLVDDPLPAGLEFVGATGAGWSCETNQATTGQDSLSCGNPMVLAAGQSAPPLVIQTKIIAAGATVTNSVQVQGLVLGRSEVYQANNVDMASVTVESQPDLAYTGSNLAVPLVGFLLLLGGSMLVSVGRGHRRRLS